MYQVNVTMAVQAIVHIECFDDIHLKLSTAYSSFNK